MSYAARQPGATLALSFHHTYSLIMEFSFKYRLGQRLFFQGKSAEEWSCNNKDSLSPDRIYEGRVVERVFCSTDLTPDDLIPTGCTKESYMLLVGAQKMRVRVNVENLRTDSADLLPLTVTYIYDHL